MLVLDKEGNVRHMISNVMNGNFIERVQETFDDNKALVFLRLGTLVEIALRSLWSNI